MTEIVRVKGCVVAIGDAVDELAPDWLGEGLMIITVGLPVGLTLATLAEGETVHVFCDGEALQLRCAVRVNTDAEGDGVTVSGLGVTVTVLLVEGVRPGDGVARPLALTGLAVAQLGVA